MNLTSPINVTNAAQKLILPPAPMMQDQNNRPFNLSPAGDHFRQGKLPGFCFEKQQ